MDSLRYFVLYTEQKGMYANATNKEKKRKHKIKKHKNKQNIDSKNKINLFF